MEQKTSFYTSYFSRLADSGEETPDFEGDFYKKLEAVMVDPKRNDYRLDLWNLQYRLEHDSSFRQEYRGWMEQCFLSACQLDGHGESVESIHPRLPDMKEKFEGARLTDKELAVILEEVEQRALAIHAGKPARAITGKPAVRAEEVEAEQPPKARAAKPSSKAGA